MGSISIKKATMINAVAKYSTVIINIIFTAVLARILSPEDFGIVAIVAVFTTFFSVLSDMGLGASIIQNKDLTERDIASIFGFSMHMSIALAVSFCILSLPISMFYNNDVYKPVCKILSIAIVFNTLNMVPNALLLKEKKFAVVGMRMVVVNIISGVLTIILAKMGAKYYALAFQSVISAAVNFIWNYSSTRPKMLMRYDKKSIDKIKSFSGFQFAFNLVNYFARNVDNLLVGKFMGSAQLAYYDKGYKLMLYPVGYLTNVITPVLHPIFSDYQKDKEYIYKQYMKVVRILSILGIFISLFCFFSSKEIILIMFGKQWARSITYFKILSLSVWAQMVCSSTGSIFLSLGNSKLMFISGTIASLEVISMILIGISFKNLTIVSIFVTAGYNISFFINYFCLIRYGFKGSFSGFLKSFIPDLLVGLIIFMVMSIIPVNISNIYISVVIKGLISGFAYVIGLLITRRYKVFTALLRINKG